MSLPIIFYDIPSTLPGKAWSPNPWKTRYALNMKGIPYETQWVEYPDIEPLAKSIGASATGTKPDGSPFYTLPIIFDPNTGRAVADSFLIAEYLDATYPTSGLTLIPHDTAPLMRAFEACVIDAIDAVDLFLLKTTWDILNPASQEHFRRTKEAIYGKNMDEFSPPDSDSERAKNWTKTRAALESLNGWLVGGEKYVMGETISYADAILAARLIWIKIVLGDESEMWKDIACWHDGRWAAYLDDGMGVYARL